MYSNLEKYVPDKKPPIGALLNPYLSINRNLIGNWPFNERAGIVANDVSERNNAILIADAHFDHGRFLGPALHFDGDGDYADTGWKPSAGKYTIVAWVKWNSFWILHGSTVIVGCHDGANHRLYFGTNGGMYYFGAGANWKNAVAHPFIIDQWYFLCYTVDESVARYYVDLVEVDNLNYAWAGTSTRSVYFGEVNWGAGHRYLNGAIDNVIIYNRVLSFSEMRQLRQDCSCGFRWMSIDQLSSYFEEAPPEIQALYMDLSTQIWTIKHSIGLFAKL